MNKSIGEIIRTSELNYTTGRTTLSKYVDFSQYENIEKIEAYLNSKHTTSDTDSMGRDKPFFNIVTGATNIWYRATDIDRKNIRIKATKSADVVGAFLATVHLQEWMKRDSFGQLLNDWGRSLARYGSSVLKFVEKGGKLHSQVIPWNRLISDTVDFENNPKIEKLYLTQAQLQQNKAYDQDKVKELIDALSSRKDLDKQKKDNINDYIEVYEIHGVLSEDLITEKESPEGQEKYVQQMHVVSMVAKGDKGDEYDDFCLLKGRESKDPYMITHLIKEDGRAQSIGAVEHLFDAQWMTNHTAKGIKDQLDLASKLIFQTADGSFVGQNALSNIETGDILIHTAGNPLTKIDSRADITALQSFGQQWQVLAKEITSTPDAISGNTMPSGTAYRQVAILNQESHSLFELMTENKGLHIEEMMRKYIIPYLKTQMDTSDEIATTLDSYNITQLDAMYVNAESTRRKNQHVKSFMLKKNGQGGEVAPPFDLAGAQAQIQGELNQTGTQRFLKPSDIPTKTWSEVLTDLEWVTEVEVTNEQSDKEAVLTTLNTVLQTVAQNPNVLTDPNMKMLFNKILEATGSISAIELRTPAPVQPQQTTTIPKTSINYKDLPPELQTQLADQAGLKTTEPNPAGNNVGGGQ